MRAKEQCAEGWQPQAQGVEAAVGGEWSGLDAAHIALSATAIFPCIAVEPFAPQPAVRYSDAVVLAHDGRKVADDQRDLAGTILAQESNDASLGVAMVYPLEPLRGEVELEQGRRFPVKLIEVANPFLHPRMEGVLQDVPLEALIVLPFAPLTELRAHEEELLARMSPHVAVQQPQVRKLLPLVPRHLADQRTLAVHHLIV